MKTLELAKGLYWTGVLDPGLRVFDIIMHTEFGTTYNSYLLKGETYTALVETAKAKYTDEYLESVASLVPLGKIDYVIVNHTEPDHAGSLERLLEINPNLKVVGTPTAIKFLREIVNRDFYSIAVKENDTLSLGGRTLRFFALPNLHWPDTMFTYVEEDGVLFTCDSFGSHFSHEGILRSTVTDVEGYLRAAKYYFDNILGPFRRPFLVAALDRIAPLRLSMICTGHGPVLDSHIDELVALYRTWCKAPAHPRKMVVMPYVSAYGYTAELAGEIAKGLAASGDLDVRLHDMVTDDPAAVSAEIGEADGVLFGTPTILGEALAPIWSLATSLFKPIHKGKLAGAFGSYGWSGEGVPNLLERLRQVGMKTVEGFRVRLKPGENDRLDAFEYGYDFGCTLQKKENDRKKPAAAPRLVRCLVCGEVFDASLTVCPVCGVGPENFVPVDAAPEGFRRDTEERFVILGGGAAAYNAAKAIRERDKTAVVVLIGDEEALPYNRPMLTKSMLARFSGDQIAIADAAWYAANEIYLIQGKTVTAIEPDVREVVCSDGTRFSYNKLVYALGARCFVPPIPGVDLPHVVAIRSLADANRVSERLPVHSAVVIGGGVLGLESAWELRKSGCEVTVLEAAPQIMSRQIDAPAAALLGSALAANGIRLVTGAKIAGITPDAVTLADGTSFGAELVVVSAGIRPNAEIAAAAGLHVDRSVVVDEHMRTSDPTVFACGDCAEFNGRNLGLWSQAVEMGRVAGANAAGDPAVYTPVDGLLAYSGLGTTLHALGDCGKDSAKSYRTLEMRDERRMQYEKYYFADNRLCGFLLIGAADKLPAMTKAFEARTKFSEFALL